MANSDAAPLIVLVAGEASGDNLGAQLITALRQRIPQARFAGIAGSRMVAAGCEAWERMENLSVMGLFEILPHLPKLLRIRRQLIDRVLAERPAVYVGVDAKEFNLRIAPRFKEAGIPTVQYVSPQVWAWRQGRVHTIGRAVDLVLCLLPFEKPFYDSHSVHAEFVGHPLADVVPMELSAATARYQLALPEKGQYVAVLPGSRQGEVSRLSPDFTQTMAWLVRERPQLRFIAALASEPARRIFEEALERATIGTPALLDRVTLINGHAQTVMAASDVVLLASGTATLEATLVKRPMVVAYRLGMLTSFLLKHLKLFKAPFFSQPNLLAGRELVPEFFNAEVRADVLGPAVLQQLDRADRDELVQNFATIHETLRRDASARAADAIVDLLVKRRLSV
ncbi:lipid-A-disaccharide synthase [Steroidobacter agaridevorans]|uniref:Lipid-A-disaccharide synthase n=1 Tax=Steroidobacter agaridevorans TaxID=2695856 RepID=A0A829YDK3_9GAMM|nr:lipid-A-disaccharide synthase [Steroidobacter agaridevorans]GFE80752.1 lipid-A-disaccharide synthase [Steroidobacter agaridevorans]GFE87853.1 lipid-A-disaccharide synthase [Steroidobacter agaridevorans]